MAAETDLGLVPVEDDGRVPQDGRHPVQDPALEHGDIHHSGQWITITADNGGEESEILRIIS